MENFSWTCPYCNRPTTITKSDISENFHNIYLQTEPDSVAIHTQFILCPNPKCRQFTIAAQLCTVKRAAGVTYLDEELDYWNLKPKSSAKPMPSYIPEQIRHDYEEACLIKNLSPKASATLSRRCIQGMIRDFWDVRKERLSDEINGIKEKIDPSTWKAIDSIRKVGNIGAHMEKDINILIDVEPKEAELLISLIEMLIKDWYVNRQERKDLLEGIIEVSNRKESEKNG